MNRGGSTFRTQQLYTPHPFIYGKYNNCPNFRLPQTDKFKDRKIVSQTSPSQSGFEAKCKLIGLNDPSQQSSSACATVKHKSTETNEFMKMLCSVFGMPKLTLKDAIDLCEKHLIINRYQLVDFAVYKYRIWPSTIEDLLVSDFGYLKVRYICLRYDEEFCREEEADENIEGGLSKDELDIINYLLKTSMTGTNSELILEAYHYFRIGLDYRKSNLKTLKTNFYRIFTGALSKAKKDKLIMLSKRVRKIQNENDNILSFYEFLSCLSLVGITEKYSLIVFKYLYFTETTVLMYIVQREASISCQILLDCLGDFNEYLSAPYKVITVTPHYMIETNQIIHQLLQYKYALLMALIERDNKVYKLYSTVQIMSIEVKKCGESLYNHIEKVRQEERAYLLKRIKILYEENNVKDNLVRKYRCELEGLMREYNCETKHRMRYFGQQ